MDPAEFLTLLSRLRGGCVVNYAREWSLSQEVGVKCARMTVEKINARDRRLVALCRGLADNMIREDGKVDCAKLEELLRLLAEHIVADHRGLVTLAERLGLDDEVMSMKRVDDQARELDDLIEATFR